MKTAGKYLRLYSVWSVTTTHLPYRPTYSVLLLFMNFFRIQCNFILYKYINIHTLTIFSLFLFYFFCILIFFRVPGCSEMFRNVPFSSFNRRPFLIASFARHHSAKHLYKCAQLLRFSMSWLECLSQKARF